VLDQCESLDFKGKSVLDMGCGTGVLGILAKMLGAEEVTCIDFDPWSVENTLENTRLNEIEGIEVLLGDANAIPERCYDILLANINRNVLMADRDHYLRALAPGGTLVISGFYNFDEAKLATHFGQAGLKLVSRKEKDQWVMMAFEKPANQEGLK
jgi:ribosomal protein L11 methyltransferase